MASIYPNKKNGKIVSFKFKVFIEKDSGGKRLFKCTTWTPDFSMTEKKMLNQAQKEAILWEHKILNDIEVYKETRKPENITLDKFINEVWIPHQENSKNLRHTTLAFNSYILKIVLQYFNDVKLCDVSSQHIEKYIHYLRNEYKTSQNATLSPKTIKHHYCLLNSVFEHAVRTENISTNPVEKVETPKLVRHRVESLSKGEVSVFIKELEKLPLKQKVMYMILLTTGIRRGECFGLKWKDIDLEHKLISIERNVSYTSKAGIVVGLPKTNTGIRIIPITDKLMQFLSEYKQSQSRSMHSEMEMFLFPSNTSPYEPQDPTYITKHMSRFMKQIGLPQMSPHDLRHTCASLLLQSGADIKSVQDILGHADASTTLNFYVKSDIDTIRSATQKAFDF